MSIAAKLSVLRAKTGATPQKAMIEAGDRRTGDSGRMDENAVEADGVEDAVGADDLDHERLPRRVVDGEDEAAEGDHDEDHPSRGRAARREHEQQQRGDHHSRLGDHQQLALVEAVGQRAAEGAEQEDAGELQGGGDPDGDPGAGQRQDQPELGDDLHPVAGQRDDLPAEVEAVVADLERGE